MVHPWLNQKHDWPLLQSLVPLVHRQLYGSMVPVLGCLPSLHSEVSASIELRVGGMISDAWPCTAARDAEHSRTRNMGLD